MRGTCNNVPVLAADVQITRHAANCGRKLRAHVRMEFPHPLMLGQVVADLGIAPIFTDIANLMARHNCLMIGASSIISSKSTANT
jgi:hypothetical protein